MSKRKGFDNKLGSVLGSSTTPPSPKTEKPKKASTAKPKAIAPGPIAEKRKVGRPKAVHNRIRFTSIVEQELRDKMKIIAIRQGIKINDAFNNALLNYVNAYEKKNGEVKL